MLKSGQLFIDIPIMKETNMLHHEIVSPDPGMPIRLITHEKNESLILPHWHRAVEINVLINGEATYTISGRRFTAYAGSVIIVNANEIHSIDHINGKPNSKAITLLIPYEFLQTQINNFKYVWYQISLDSDHQEIFDEI